LTVVIIAHRLSMVKNADRVYVLDEGRVIEEGSC
jgi:ABC-type multidrug transport system fused ATPase/permease subunit